MRRSVSRLAICLICLLPAVASAHHGKSFLNVETFEGPRAGGMLALLDSGWFRHESGNATELSPAFLYGLTDRLYFEAHAHMASEPGQSLEYEAFAPALHYQLNERADDDAWGLAIAGEYERAAHIDESDRVELRLVADRALGKSLLAVNLTASQLNAAGASIDYGYSIGLRTHHEGTHGWGIEASGGLNHGADHEVLLGYYGQPSHSLFYKAGIGRAFGNSEAANLVVRASIGVLF